MASIAAEIDLKDLGEHFKKFAERFQNLDFRPEFKAIALILESFTKNLFEKGESPEGIPWKPLKRPRNRARDQRARGGEGNVQRPLRDRGFLMASFSGGANHVEDITATVLNWGTRLEYAAVNQFGHAFQRPERVRGPGEKPFVFQAEDGSLVFTKRIRAHTQTVPARPFLGLNQQLKDDIAATLLDGAMRQV